MTVEGLTSDGQAFVRDDDREIRLKGFLPGDKLEILFSEKGRISSVLLLEPSPDRVKPDCFFHGPCGGCDLLELSEKGRKKEKQAMIMRAIKAIPYSDKVFVHSFLASREIIRYLPRVRLHQSRNYDERESGFLASEQYEDKVPGGVVPVTACALITPPLARRLVATRKILSQIPICLESLTLMSSSSHHSDRVVGHAVLMKGKTAANCHENLKKILRSASLKGLSVASHDGKMKKVYDTVSVTGLVAPDVDGGPYDAEPSFFVQGNIYQNQVLIRKVLEFCKPEPGTRIIEGFAGAGNFTLALAATGAKIEAVESHPGAVRTGNKNIARSGFADRITLTEGDAIKDLAKLAPEPDVLLLDPPRTGTPGIGRMVSKLKPARIVCVFCDLNAMVKDSSAIIRSGYRLGEVAGIDLYPRTHHVEAICLFEKS
jgi:23S rRNA (uracil1939-C5)-methyltransferase